MADLIRQAQEGAQQSVEVDPTVVDTAPNYSIAEQTVPEMVQNLPQPEAPVSNGPLPTVDFSTQPQLQQTVQPTPIQFEQTDRVALEQALATPTFVPPSFDFGNTAEMSGLFSGPTRADLIRARSGFLPNIQQNPVSRQLFPQQPPSEAPGRVRRDRGSSWLQRIFGNSSDNPQDPNARWMNPWRALTQGEFGEYGTGPLGALFYALDTATNLPRAALLDILANDVALFDAITQDDGSGLNLPFGQNFRNEYRRALLATDSMPEDDEYIPYFARALSGDDQSPFNFQRDTEGGYNPLGLLGNNSQTFYDEVERFNTESDTYVAGAETNLGAAGRRLQRLLSGANPVFRNMPRALGTLFVDILSDPTGPLTDAAAYSRQIARRQIQVAPPPAGAIVRIERQLSERLPVSEARRVGEAIRIQRRAGSSMPDAIRTVQQDPRNRNLPVDLGQLIRPEWRTPPRVIITNPPNASVPQIRALLPQAQFDDFTRSRLPINPAELPRIRTPQETTRVVNSQINIVPAGMTQTQIDRIVDSLPPTVADELSLSSRRIGTRVPDDLPSSSNIDIPRILDNVGDELTLQPNVILRRASERTIELRRTGVVNQDEFIPNLRAVLASTRQRVVYNLPDDSMSRNAQRRLLEPLGFVEQGNRMIYTPRRQFVDDVVPFRRRQPANVIETIADNTDRPRGEYTDRIVRDFNERLAQRQQRQVPADELASRRPNVETPQPTLRPVGEVEQLPSTRAGLRTLRDEVLPDVIPLDAARANRESGETLEEMFQRADSIMDSPLYNDTPGQAVETPEIPSYSDQVSQVYDSVPEEERLFPIADFTPKGRRRTKSKSSADTASTSPVKEPEVTLTFDQAERAISNRFAITGEMPSREGNSVWQRAWDKVAADNNIPEPTEEEIVKQAVKDLIAPDVVANPDAYDEVQQTLPEFVAPIEPDSRALREVQVYTERREATADAFNLVSQLEYQLDQIKQTDVEEFYDMVNTYPDELSLNQEEISRLLTEDSVDYQVLWERYETMLENPSTRNVQGYLSQLEYTVEEHLREAFAEATRQFDLMENQRDLLRRITTEQNEEYIQRVLDDGQVQEFKLQNEIGGKHGGPCL